MNRKSPPKLAKFLIKSFSIFHHEQMALGDLEEIYDQLLEDEGKKYADKWYWRQALKSIPHLLNNIIFWGEIMFKNYTLISFRNFAKNKLFSFINIAGLALGVASCIFIFMFIQHELSYDTFQDDYERIYRIAMMKKTESKIARWGVNTPMLSPTLKDNYYEVENIGRFSDIFNSQVKRGTNMFYEDVNYADTEFLEVFSMRIVHGKIDGALDRPATAVLTKGAAVKYFGDENPIGKTIQVDTTDFEITAVIEDPPSNTHLNYEILLSLISMKNAWWYVHWPSGTCFTYVKLIQGTDPIAFENKIRNLADNYSANFNQIGIKIEYFLQPLADIHLYSNLDYEHESPGNPTYIYIFSVVGMLVLFIACMNFINLSTAKSANRANEVGVRKAIGAHQKQLIYQFLYESVLLSLSGSILAVVIMIISLPYFNDLTGFGFVFSELLQWEIILIYFVFAILLGVVAGIYPSIVVSSFNPTKILKGNISAGSRNPFFRKILVTAQFTISIILIIGTMIIFRQIDFMQSQNLGFNNKQKLVLSFPDNGYLRNNYNYVKNEFLKSAEIDGAASSSHLPGRQLSTTRIYLTGKEAETGISMEYIYIDYDFLDVFDIPLLAGRNFMEEMGTDTAWGGLILNEAGIKSFSFTTPEEAVNNNFWRRSIPLIGVMKDFHFKGLQNEVDPIYFSFAPRDFKYVTLDVNSNDIRNTVSFVENKWNELFPNEPIEYFFLDKEFNKQYRQETQTAGLFRIFTLLGIFIACLGLFGLSAFIVEQRKKEIGIRKVLGATEKSIIKIISSEFVLLITLSNLIAWPVAYFAIDIWLQNFAYKTPISFDLFLVAGGAAFLLTILTVGTQALKAANLNPVDSIGNE